MLENTLFSYRARQGEPGPISSGAAVWRKCEEVTIDRYWNGSSPFQSQGHNWANLTHVRSCWNSQAVFFHFQAWFDRLDVNPEWSTETTTDTLYERDVVEVFLRPPGREDYFEINISPLGQWLSAHILKPRISVDFQWRSDLRLRAECDRREQVWRVFLGVPYASISAPCPEVGGAWNLSLCRIAGEGADREYLAWRPTFTERPDFHIPASFGHLIFLGGEDSHGS